MTANQWKDSPWTDAAVAKLKELWPEPGMSASRIALQIPGVSRNAVIGKAARLGLGSKPSHSPYTTTTHKAVRKPRPYKVKPVASFSQWVTTYPDKEPEPFVPRAVALPSLCLPIDAWSDDTCKYIAGDDRLACGHPVMESKPYCQAHCEIVYVQKAERTPAQKANDAKMAERGRASINARGLSRFVVEDVA